MDNQDLIESGLLESHLLGFTTEEEKEYVSQKLITDQDTSDYVSNLENGIKKYFDQKSISPPPALRDIIQLRITRPDTQKEKHNFDNKSKKESSKKDEYLDIQVDDTHIKVHKNWRPAFIAVFILSKIFLIAGLYYYFKTVNLQEEILRLQTEETHQAK